MSNDDAQVLDVEGRVSWRFPVDETGGYPADGREAVGRLEGLRALGAAFLVLPDITPSWVERYGELRDHFERHYSVETHDDGRTIVDLKANALRRVVAEAGFEFVRDIPAGEPMRMTTAENYFRFGLAALVPIRSALEAVGRPVPRSILDLPSGYGRVLRMLRGAYPQARIVACDLDVDAVEFCARVHGAVPVVSRERLEELDLPEAFDLIWCGSLLTHLDHDGWRSFLAFSADHLEQGGVLVFTAHGPWIAGHVRTGERRFALTDTPGLVAAYDRDGFGFAPYRNSPKYGISLSTPAWVEAEIGRHPSLSLLFHAERGWNSQHDVFACVRA